MNETIRKHSTNHTKQSKYKQTYYQNTHTLQNKLKQSQCKTRPHESHNTFKYPQYKVTLMCRYFYPQEKALLSACVMGKELHVIYKYRHNKSKAS